METVGQALGGGCNRGHAGHAVVDDELSGEEDGGHGDRETLRGLVHGRGHGDDGRDAAGREQRVEHAEDEQACQGEEVDVEAVEPRLALVLPPTPPPVSHPHATTPSSPR
eukprot:3095842-Rhodomonas_salina.1